MTPTPPSRCTPEREAETRAPSRCPLPTLLQDLELSVLLISAQAKKHQHLRVTEGLGQLAWSLAILSSLHIPVHNGLGHLPT